MNTSHYWIKRDNIISKIEYKGRTFFNKFELINEPLSYQVMKDHDESKITRQLTGPEADHVHLPPVVKDNKIRLARALGRAKIISIFDLLVRTETDVKSGRAEPEQALELLVVNLGRLFT